MEWQSGYADLGERIVNTDVDSIAGSNGWFVDRHGNSHWRRREWQSENDFDSDCQVNEIRPSAGIEQHENESWRTALSPDAGKLYWSYS